MFSAREVGVLSVDVPQLHAQHRPENVREKGSDVVRTNFAAHRCIPFAKLVCHLRRVKPAMRIFGEPVYLHRFKINGKMAFDGDVWQWRQDCGTWKNDDWMPEARARNVAVFLDDANEFNGPPMFIPASHELGVLHAEHDTTATSYPLWTLDHDTIAKLVARGGRGAERGGSPRHRCADGPSRSHDPVSLLLGARLRFESLAAEPRRGVPVAVCGVESHPPVQATGTHGASGLHADRMSARRLFAQGLPGAVAVERRNSDRGTARAARGGLG